MGSRMLGYIFQKILEVCLQEKELDLVKASVCVRRHRWSRGESHELANRYQSLYLYPAACGDEQHKSRKRHAQSRILSLSLAVVES